MIANSHFNQILNLSDILGAAPVSHEDPILHMFINYLQNAIALTKFIKSVKGLIDEQIKLLQQQVPAKKPSGFANLKSPERQVKTAQTKTTERSIASKVRSPENRNDFKSELNAELYKKETEELIMSHEKKLQLDQQKHNLTTIQMSINKMKFDMEREEKQVVKALEKQAELRYLEFLKE